MFNNYCHTCLKTTVHTTPSWFMQTPPAVIIATCMVCGRHVETTKAHHVSVEAYHKH